jgi:hypothetical protein
MQKTKEDWLKETAGIFKRLRKTKKDEEKLGVGGRMSVARGSLVYHI